MENRKDNQIKSDLNVCLLMLCILLFATCKKPDDDPNTLPIIQLQAFANQQTLTANSSIVLSSQDTLQVRKFKLYLSNISFENTNTGKSAKAFSSYHLFSLTEPETGVIQPKNIPEDTYNQLTFYIGVDSVANSKADRIGDLEPSSDMSWGWTLGYKFLSLEGKYKDKGVEKGFVYHIGENKAFRKISLSLTKSFPQGFNPKNKIPIVLHMDLDKLFNNSKTLKIRENPAIESFVAGGNIFAENYAREFIYLP